MIKSFYLHLKLCCLFPQREIFLLQIFLPSLSFFQCGLCSCYFLPEYVDLFLKRVSLCLYAVFRLSIGVVTSGHPLLELTFSVQQLCLILRHNCDMFLQLYLHCRFFFIRDVKVLLQSWNLLGFFLHFFGYNHQFSYWTVTVIQEMGNLLFQGSHILLQHHNSLALYLVCWFQFWKLGVVVLYFVHQISLLLFICSYLAFSIGEAPLQNSHFLREPSNFSLARFIRLFHQRSLFVYQLVVVLDITLFSQNDIMVIL